MFGRWDWADAEMPGEKLGLFGWEVLAYVRLVPSEALAMVAFLKGQTFSTHPSLVPGQVLSTDLGSVRVLSPFSEAFS